MKQKFTLILFICLLTAVSRAQTGQLPVFIIFPSDVWCTTNNYVITSTGPGGREKKNPDFERALRENPQLESIIIALTDGFQQNGITPKYLKQIIDNILEEAELDETLDVAASVSDVALLLQKARADVKIEIGTTIFTNAGKKTLSVNLGIFESYTAENIFAKNFDVPLDNTSFDTALRNVIAGFIGEAADAIKEKFEYQKINGRKVVVTITRTKDYEMNLNSDINGNLLWEIIKSYATKNSVKGEVAEAKGPLDDLYEIEPLIPMLTSEGKSMVANDFARELSKYLKKEFNIPSKVTPISMGRVKLVIGQ
jgi:hypothetical protein